MTPSSGQDHSEPDAAWASTAARAGSARARREPGRCPGQPVGQRRSPPDTRAPPRPCRPGPTFRSTSPARAGPWRISSGRPTARPISSASAATVVSTPVPAWNSSPATSSSGASSDRLDRRGQVVGVDEVAGLLAVAVDLDRLARQGRPEPRRDDAPLVERVRPVGVGEAQRAGGQPERRRVGLAVRLDRQLRRAVRRDRMGKVGLVARWRMVAGGGVRRGEDEAPDAGQPGRSSKPDRPGHVGLERPERVAHRIVDPGPRRQVDDGVDAGDRRADRVRIRQRAAHEVVRHAVQVGGLADRQVVEDPDPVAARGPAAASGWSR